MKKLFSIIMCVLMVMCFMPTLAFAGSEDGGTQVTYSPVYVMNSAGTVIELADGQGLESNEATTATTISGNSYVAKYSGGTLYLKGYNIEVSKDATASETDATVALNAINGNSFKINVESASSIKLTNTADNGFVRAIYASYLALSGAEKLTIEVSHTPQNEANTTKSGTGVYGINAECGAKIEAPVDITMTGKCNAYGIGADCGTISLTGGDKSIDVSNAGQSAFGVYNYAASYAEEYLGITTGNGDINVDCNLNIVIDATKDGKGIFSYDGTTRVSSGTFNFDPTSYVDGNSYIVKRSGSAGAYTYTVLAKADLTSGTYLTDPAGSLASYYYSYQNEDGTYTVYYSAPSKSTTTDNVTNTTETTKTDGATTTVPETKATVKAETKTAADGTKTTTSTVDTTTAAKIVEKAVANKSEEVIVNAGTTAVAETAAGTTTEVAIPAETVSQIAEKTTAAVKIETEAAEVMLDEQAVEAVAEQAGETGNVKLVVETKAQDENKVEVELKLETDKGAVSDFKGGTVSVTVKLNSALAAKPVMCVYIDDNGVYHKVAGHKNADGTYTFTTGHFSTYAIMSEDEANDVIADQAASAKDDVKALSLKARSSKTSKGSIKVNLTVSGDELQDIEKLGYTVKYKFYRSTKKSSGYTAMKEKDSKTYTNTTGKKGTRYYYKARVMVYDSEGTLIAKSALKQCKYACRTK